jgi:hypothetical protein
VGFVKTSAITGQNLQTAEEGFLSVQYLFLLSGQKHNDTNLVYWFCSTILKGDQKVSVHLMITIQKFTSNVQAQSDSWQPTARARGTLDSH